jgi:hypothetical protein
MYEEAIHLKICPFVLSYTNICDDACNGKSDNHSNITCSVTVSIDVPYLHCSFKDYQLYKAEKEIVKTLYM